MVTTCELLSGYKKRDMLLQDIVMQLKYKNLGYLKEYIPNCGKIKVSLVDIIQLATGQELSNYETINPEQIESIVISGGVLKQNIEGMPKSLDVFVITKPKVARGDIKVPRDYASKEPEINDLLNGGYASLELKGLVNFDGKKSPCCSCGSVKQEEGPILRISYLTKEQIEKLYGENEKVNDLAIHGLPLVNQANFQEIINSLGLSSKRCLEYEVLWVGGSTKNGKIVLNAKIVPDYSRRGPPQRFNI
ncbi:hypothetical protein KY347_05075 [Candidatus Woesearchaeota archaeon]|nr:hypothetical protein [Candidatus Woesearchaeota archaeon]